MNLTSSVDNNLDRWPRPLAKPAFTWWPAWMVRAAAAARRAFRRAALRARTRRAQERLAMAVQHLDDRLLRDIGIEATRVRRPPAGWRALRFRRCTACTDPDRPGERHGLDHDERRYADWLIATYGKRD